MHKTQTLENEFNKWVATDVCTWVNCLHENFNMNKRYKTQEQKLLLRI